MPCAQHKRKSWTDPGNVNRNRHLPSDWKARCSFVMRRDAGICHVCRQPGSDRVDHVVPRSEGGSDDVSNLAPIHERPCHAIKSEQERKRGHRR